MVMPKSVKQISNELFTSLFVLNSSCRFLPKRGQDYWLYRSSGTYQLLMLGPDDWASGSPNPCLGKCRCQWDMTWTLEVQPAGEHDSTFQLDVATAREKFERQFEAAEQLSDTLPKFDAAMPYNQRVMAHVLRQSLSASMKASGISELSAVEARALFRLHDNPLPPL
jgi:hypothetical protein